jgi:hypothetical protein
MEMGMRGGRWIGSWGDRWRRGTRVRTKMRMGMMRSRKKIKFGIEI